MRRLLVALALGGVVVGGGSSARAEDPPRTSWAWLASAPPEDSAPKFAPDLGAGERSVLDAAWRSSVTLALAPNGERPPEGAAEACGFLVSKDGLFVAPWRFLSAGADLRGRFDLWARTWDGPWERTVLVGACWWADVGVARLSTKRDGLRPLAFAPPSPPPPPGTRLLGVGSSLRRRHALTVGAVERVEWFDPDRAGGRTELRRDGPPRPTAEGAIPLRLGCSDALAADGGAGSAVLDESGRVVGVVAGFDASRPPAERVLVRPADLVRPVVDLLVARGAFDPLDLGVRFEPAPSKPGEPTKIPPDLEAARVAGKERGGVLVSRFHAKSPANTLLWFGETLVAIDGRPVFAEVPESLGFALLSMREGVPADVLVVRGAKRASVSVTPLRGRAIYPDFQAESDARAGGLRAAVPK